jgi:biopolymer transport protein ExbD
MKITSRKGYLVTLESVTMTDIVLNMFIFFFISFSLLYTFNAERVHSVKVELPNAGNAVTTEDIASLSITITDSGVLYLDKTRVTGDELKREIARAYKNNPEINVALYSDKQTPFKDIVRVLSVLSEHKIRNLDIGVIKEEDNAPAPQPLD